MARQQFKANIPLWLPISATLFVPPWFIGTMDKGDEVHAEHLWLTLFSHPLNFSAVVAGIVSCTLLFGIPALGVGWVIHCLIIMVHDRFRATGRSEPPPES